MRACVTYLIGGVHGQTARAGDEISSLQESQGVLKALLAVAGENLRVRGEQNSAESDHVVFAHLYARPGYLNLGGGSESPVSLTFPNLEDGENVVVLWADVAVTTERRHGDSVGVQHW